MQTDISSVTILLIVLGVFVFFFWKTKKANERLKEEALKKEFDLKIKDLKERSRITDDEVKELVKRFRDTTDNDTRH